MARSEVSEPKLYFLVDVWGGPRRGGRPAPNGTLRAVLGLDIILLLQSLYMHDTIVLLYL